MSNLYINPSSIFFIDSPLYVSGNVTFAGGESYLQDSDWTIGGNLTATANAAFAPLSFNRSAFVVGGNFSFTGAANALLDLEASQAWTLDVTGTGTAAYVRVAYSDASAGSTIVGDATCEDEGNTLNWTFVAVNIEEALYDLLTSIEALAGIKIYPGRVPQKAIFPAISYNRVNSGYTPDLVGTINTANPEFHFHLFSYSFEELGDMETAILYNLDDYSGTFHGLQIKNIIVSEVGDLPVERSGDGSDHILFHRVLTVKVWHQMPRITNEVIIVSPGHDHFSFEDVLIAILETNDDTRDYKVYPHRLPQKAVMPAIYYTRPSTGLIRDLNGRLELHNPTILLHILADTYGATVEVANTLRSALDNATGVVGNHTIANILVKDNGDFPPEKSSDGSDHVKFHRVLEVSMWFTED